MNEKKEDNLLSLYNNCMMGKQSASTYINCVSLVGFGQEEQNVGFER